MGIGAVLVDRLQHCKRPLLGGANLKIRFVYTRNNCCRTFPSRDGHARSRLLLDDRSADHYN